VGPEEHLESDVALELLVGRAVDDAHASFADLPPDHVLVGRGADATGLEPGGCGGGWSGGGRFDDGGGGVQVPVGQIPHLLEEGFPVDGAGRPRASAVARVFGRHSHLSRAGSRWARSESASTNAPVSPELSASTISAPRSSARRSKALRSRVTESESSSRFSTVTCARPPWPRA